MVDGVFLVGSARWAEGGQGHRNLRLSRSPEVVALASALILLLGCSNEPPPPHERDIMGVLMAGSSSLPVAGAQAGASPVAGTAAPVAGGLPVAGMVAAAGVGAIAGQAAPAAGEGQVTGGVTAMRIFDAGNDPARNDVMPGGICDRLATIQCAGEAYCCDAPGRDVQACIAATASTCREEAHLDDIAAQQQTGFDSGHLRSAFERLEMLASTCDPTIAYFGQTLEGLRGTFKGSIEAGGDCMPGNALDTVEAGASLASCSDPSANACLPGLFEWNCEPVGAAGADCFTDVNCGEGLFCDNPDLSIRGSTCEARKGVGEPCGLPNECVTLLCSDAGACAEGDVQAAYCL